MGESVVSDARLLARWESGWDELARASGRPYCSPGWMLAWWRHLRPPGAELRTVVVHEDGELRGIAPLWLHRGKRARRDMRILACGFSQRIDLLAQPGHEGRLASSVARMVQDSGANLLGFENIDVSTPWPRLVRDRWPGRPRPAPVTAVALETPALRPRRDWLAARSRNLRKKVEQGRRRLAAEGVEIGLARTPSARAEAIEAFGRLHEHRWRSKGGSALPIAATVAGLRAAAEALPPDRLRLWSARRDEQSIAVQILVAAGGEVASWAKGWDERHARLRPSLVVAAAAIDDAAARDDRLVDLGAGATEFKLALADRDLHRAVHSPRLVARNARWPLTQLEMGRDRLVAEARRSIDALPAERRRRVRGAARAVRAVRR